MIRSNWRLAAVLGGVLVFLLIVGAGALIVHDRDAREQAVRDARHRKYLRARDFSRAYRKSKREAAVPESERRRCDIPGTETIDLLPNARIYETNYRRGEVDSEDPATNRVFACHYETGRRTDLGINDTMSGNSFGLAEGAGDFLAYATSMWLPADGSADCFFVVNLRSQEPVHGDPSCNDAQSSEAVNDIVVTAEGSFAYSTVADRSLDAEIVVKTREYPKTHVVDAFKFDGAHDIRLLHQDGQLKWLDSERNVETIAFR